MTEPTTAAAVRLSPRQRECLRLVWERQATSKEIAIALGIGKPTVDGYIAEAVDQLGARDRRDAARIAFGPPPAQSGGDPARVVVEPIAMTETVQPTDGFFGNRPWRTEGRPRNALSFVQTIGWIAFIAIVSIAVLALATSVGNGLPAVAKPVINGVRQLTR